MFEYFAQNQLYIVLVIVLTIWFGILIYLKKLEQKVDELENILKNKKVS